MKDTLGDVFGSPHTKLRARTQEYAPLKSLTLLEKEISQLKERRLIQNMGVGVEVEVENIREFRDDIQSYWNMETDGSLRNNGREYITVYGLRVHHLEDAFTLLFNNMKDAQRRTRDKIFTFGERTSIHVHLDVRALTMEELTSVLAIYTCLEDALFKFAGDERKYNIFCVPLRASNRIDINNKLIPYIQKWTKYCALNAGAIREKGTLEFRHMQGNNNQEHILRWVYILGCIIAFAKKNESKIVSQWISTLKKESNYLKFTDVIFGPLAKYIQCDANMDEAVSDAKHFLSHARHDKKPAKASLKDYGQWTEIPVRLTQEQQRRADQTLAWLATIRRVEQVERQEPVRPEVPNENELPPIHLTEEEVYQDLPDEVDEFYRLDFNNRNYLQYIQNLRDTAFNQESQPRGLAITYRVSNIPHLPDVRTSYILRRHSTDHYFNTFAKWWLWKYYHSFDDMPIDDEQVPTFQSCTLTIAHVIAREWEHIGPDWLQLVFEIDEPNN